MLEHAISYAKRGWPIFPCRADKTPYTPNGVLDATTNEERIREWWGRWPRANIGLDCAGAGLMVLDLDPGADSAFCDKLSATALSQKTPRGGKHLFYQLDEGEIVPPSVSKIAPHVDVRSFHSYVLLAPSRTDAGAYEWVSEGKPAFRPQEIFDAATATARRKSEDRDTWLIEPDLPENVASAIKWLREDAKPAIEGLGGDAMAYATAAHLKSFGVSQALAFDLMWEHWNPRCVPPWGADEYEHLEQKVGNGYRYNTSPPGNLTPAYRIARTQSVFKPLARESASGKEFEGGRFRVVDRNGMDAIRQPEWLIENFIAAESYAMLFGQPGSGKTFVALDIALSVATGSIGFPWDGLWQPHAIRKPGPVLFAVGEGRPQIRTRIAAWEKRHWKGEKAHGIFLADPVPLVGEDLNPFIQTMLAASPDGYRLVVLDTIGRSMQGLNENAQEHASKFTALVERLQSELGAAVLALHHSGVDNKDRERGSSVFRADTDTSVRVDRDGDSPSVSLYMVKQKDAQAWAKPIYAKLAKVQLDPELSSLAVESTGAQGEAKSEQEPEARKKEIFLSEATADVIENALRDILKGNPWREWNQREIAEAVAHREDVELSSDTLRTKQLIKLRERKDRIARNWYDPAKKKWRWKEPG